MPIGRMRCARGNAMPVAALERDEQEVEILEGAERGEIEHDAGDEPGPSRRSAHSARASSQVAVIWLTTRMMKRGSHQP